VISGEYFGTALVDVASFPAADYTSISATTVDADGAIHFVGFNAKVLDGLLDITRMIFGNTNSILATSTYTEDPFIRDGIDQEVLRFMKHD